MRARTGLGILTGIAVVAVLAVGGPTWREHWTAWRDRPDPDRLARAVERADHATRREADASIRYLVTGAAADRSDLSASRIATDRSLRVVRDRLAAASPAARRAVGTFVTDWSTWGRERIDIDRRTVSDTRALARFDTLTAAAANAADALATVRHADALDRRAIAQVARARVAVATEQRAVEVGLTRGELPPEVVTSLRAVPGALHATLAPARDALAPAGIDLTAYDRARTDAASIAATARTGTTPAASATDWEVRARREQAGLDVVVSRALDLAARTEATDRAGARSSLRATSIAIVTALAAVLAGGFLLDRRVRRRTRAGVRVPTAPVATGSAPMPTDADLLVTLVRRNRPLLQRQRALLQELDASTVDERGRPVVEELDRLATRMQRNGDSMLVVAHVDRDPITNRVTPLGDVVRAAVAQLTRYTRVDVVGLPSGIAVTGPVVDDLVHLLAELLENAAAFSAPGGPVRVIGRRTGSGVELAVVDRGTGMTRAEVDRWNQVLTSSAGAADRLSPATGLAVVGRLAGRTGATVRLHARPEAGTCAVVSLPERLLEPLGATDPVDPVGAAGAPPAAAVDVSPRPAGNGGHPAVARHRHLPTGTLHRAPLTPRPTGHPNGPSLSRRTATIHPLRRPDPDHPS